MSSDSETDKANKVKKSAKPHSFIPDDLAFESDAVFVNQRKTRASKPSSAYVGSKAYEAAYSEVRRKLGNERHLLDEFQRAQWRAGSNRKCSIAARPDLAPLNRYYDSLPFDFNRVILFREDDNATGYINASHLESPTDEQVQWNYIVSQGPLEHTTGDFWEMVWMRNSPLVIMLTREIEKDIEGKLKSKCERYWPDDDELGCIQVYCRIMVTLETVDRISADLTRRHFKLRCIYSKEERDLDHYHYTGWSDISQPKETETIRKLLHILEKSGCLEKEYANPAIIHCNSAVGRSMAFVAMSIALKKISEAEPYDRGAGKEAVDMFNMIVGLRRLRNSAIHSKELVQLIYRVLHDELQSKLEPGMQLG